MTTIDRRQLIRRAAASAAAVVVANEVLTMPVHAQDGIPGSGGGKELGEAESLDGRPFPAYDYSRANRLPREMTGYWEKSFDVGGVRRTAKVYISSETPIRSYYTVLAVPDGMDTGDFLHRTGWRDIADQRGEGLFVLEPGNGGWGAPLDERAYVDAAMAFYQANNYFSIFGEHYLVGYGAGAPALEAWAAAHPLRVIAQVYLDSTGLPVDYLEGIGPQEFDGDTDGNYVTVDFPEGFDLIRHDEVVLPTWYLNPQSDASASIDYWLLANDVDRQAARDRDLGIVYKQRAGSPRWMTSWSGPISQVAIQDLPVSYWSKRTTRQILAFLTSYTRYENFFAYGNQLTPRPDLERLGVEIHTMEVAGFIREYLVYVPESAHQLWGDSAPVVFVWPGNSQTDLVFFDSTQWWQVARDEGCVLVFVCEQYSNTSVSVSHRDSDIFFQQLREVMTSEYAVDPTRFYSTGQSAGSNLTQRFALAKPEYYAAVASTSSAPSPDSAGNVEIDGVSYPAALQPIPTYLIHGYGDSASLEGDLWDDLDNALDAWAAYHLDVNGFSLDDVDLRAGRRSGWYERFRTWTWTDAGTSAPMVKVTRNLYRSHNNIQEETPMLWDFLRHYSHQVDPAGNVTRYYSPSGFRNLGDRVRLDL
jgi:hypothetical protein